MASLATLVPKLRPMLVSGALLAIAVVALRDGGHHHDCGQRHRTLATLGDGSVRRAPVTLDLDPWDHPTDVPWLIRPSTHPDARPWPHGMVIGLHQPTGDAAIVLWDHSALDSVLSAFVSALRALDS